MHATRDQQRETTDVGKWKGYGKIKRYPATEDIQPETLPSRMEEL